MIKIYCIVCDKYGKFKSPKIYMFEKSLCLSILFYFIFFFFFAVNVVMNRKILIKQDKSIKILKNLGLITNIEEYQKM